MTGGKSFRRAFWLGVAYGTILSVSVFSGVVVPIYCVIQIVAAVR